MAYKHYQTLVLIPQGHSLSLSSMQEHLQDAYADRSVVLAPRSDTSYAIRIQDDAEGELNLYWEETPRVLKESQEIAETYAQAADREAVASCARRISVACDDDSVETFAEDCERLLGMLEGIQGIFIFDPASGALERTG